ncbi:MULTISPECIES: hypothetical protein [unclassified Roseateles]|uniref:hypothetical protein n=1 Tax=unclassified Roseateles TaxID=2626991 RepID=UPI000733A843|nr:hypothetical protein [Paucibacter sp. KCTC 42545]ALT79380.1 hypothetical protein AT984_21460 [Paucibacter sp. KCTC 42545]MBY0236812.1 hypothetical protein [Burkholderiaceae bacterium]
MKRYYSHQDKDIFITAGSAKELAPGSFGVCAIGGGAEGWSVVHIGPEGDVADLGQEYYFATPEEALEFVKELIDMMIAAAEPGESR